ncbi:MAG: hypothetical protein Q9185_006356 [Variospora sp. 1 TL-2023]
MASDQEVIRELERENRTLKRRLDRLEVDRAKEIDELTEKYRKLQAVKQELEYELDVTADRAASQLIRGTTLSVAGQGEELLSYDAIASGSTVEHEIDAAEPDAEGVPASSATEIPKTVFSVEDPLPDEHDAEHPLESPTKGCSVPIDGPEAMDGWRPLASLAPSEKVYLGVDGDDGGLRLPINIIDPTTWTGKGHHPLEGRHLVALALTELCCEQRTGKVYYFPNYANLLRLGMPNLSQDTQLKSASIFQRLPKLGYSPEKWGEEDVKVWNEMSHVDRLSLLNLRAGTIRRRAPILPVDLTIEQCGRTSVRLNAYNEHNPEGRATLLIMPQAYLGWHAQLSENHVSREFQGSGWQDGKGAYLIADEGTLEKHRAGDGHAIIQRLWQMFFAGVPRSLSSVDEAVNGAIRLQSLLFPSSMPTEVE